MLKKISQEDEENQARFIENILLPEKLKDEYFNEVAKQSLNGNLCELS